MLVSTSRVPRGCSSHVQAQILTVQLAPRWVQRSTVLPGAVRGAGGAAAQRMAAVLGAGGPGPPPAEHSALAGPIFQR